MENWLTNSKFNFWKWLVFMIFAFVIGIVLACVLAGVLYGLRKEKDKEINFVNSLNSLIMPCLFTGVAIVFVIVSAMRYKCIPVELLVLSALFIAGFFSSINNKLPALFFIIFGIIIFYLGSFSLIRLIIERVKLARAKLP